VRGTDEPQRPRKGGNTGRDEFADEEAALRIYIERNGDQLLQVTIQGASTLKALSMFTIATLVAVFAQV